MSVDIPKNALINSDAQPVPFNCTIDIENKHNHPVNSLYALIVLNISEETHGNVKWNQINYF